MGKTGWYNQYKNIEGQSNFHKAFQTLFQTETPFKHFHCWQEVPVKDLVPDYKYSHRFDWYIEELNLIIELHGRQHYEAVNFGNQDYYQNKRTFNKSLFRDSLKRSAAEQFGYLFLEIPYTQKPSTALILNFLQDIT